MALGTLGSPGNTAGGSSSTLGDPQEHMWGHPQGDPWELGRGSPETFGDPWEQGRRVPGSSNRVSPSTLGRPWTRDRSGPGTLGTPGSRHRGVQPQHLRDPQGQPR